MAMGFLPLFIIVVVLGLDLDLGQLAAMHIDRAARVPERPVTKIQDIGHVNVLFLMDQ